MLLEALPRNPKNITGRLLKSWLPSFQTRVPRAKSALVDKALSESRGEEDDNRGEEDVKYRRHQHPFLDVQAALYVLARREHILEPKDDDRFINLSNTDLRDADLRGANLKGARLRQVNLKGAILHDVAF